MQKRFQTAQNKVIRVEGHDFLFLSADNAIFEMDLRTREILQQWSEAGELTKEDALARWCGALQEGEDFFDAFVNRRLLIPVQDSTPEGEKAPVHQALIPLKTLILHVTDSCNLGCLYCYHSQDGDHRKKPGKPMDFHVACKAVDFLLEHSGPLKKLVLVFFGGEPLLRSDLIRSTVRYAQERASKEGKEIDFAVTTNGTLLSEEVICFLRENHFSVTVSMDGFEEIHDRHRCFRNGAPSYRTILSGVSRLLEMANERPVVARVTVVKDPQQTPRILNHLLGLGFAEAGFAPVTTKDPTYQLSSDGMQLLLDQFGKLSERFLEFARRDELLGFTNLIDLLVVLHQGEVMNYPCGAGLGLFSVDGEGRLYLCQRFAGKESFTMGDIFEGFDADRLEDFRTKAEISRKKPCLSCWVRSTCAGGCYYESWIRQGDSFSPNVHYCEWIRKWVEMGLKVYCEIALSNPEYLEKLSMLRGHTSTLFNSLH